MELDELKQAWAKSSAGIKRSDRDIFEIVRSGSTGPAALLKRRFKRGMIVLPLVIGMGIWEMSKRHSFVDGVLAGYLIIFGAVIMTYFYLNYRLMNRMQTVEGNVKEQLQKQVNLLKRGLQWRLWITRAMAVVFILLTELSMYYRLAPEFDQWHQRNGAVRLGVYTVGFLFIYLLTRFATGYRYKRHILHLQALIEQIG